MGEHETDMGDLKTDIPFAEAGPTAKSEELAEKDTNRVEAFSDGVFAVALTLLVVSLTVPEIGANRAVSARELLQALFRQWPQFVAFAASFFSVLLLWISHHQTFAMIRRTSRSLMLANGLLLFLVTLIPFPTAMLARYIQTPGGSVAAALYAGVFLLITASFMLLWHVILSQPGLLKSSLPDVQKRDLRRRRVLGFACYVVAVGVAFWQPYLTVLICILLAVYWVVIGDSSRPLQGSCPGDHGV